MTIRCAWAQASTADCEYHDYEWGVPVQDDQRWFEFLVLEGAQAGLSWSTIINKRPAYREVYEGFDPAKVAAFDEAKIETMLQDARIVRNRRKILSSINNARVFLQIQRQHGSFNAYIWNFVDGRPIQNRWQAMSEVPAITPESERMSKALKAEGFSFVGPTICYALMQATGMVNDHISGCYRHAEVLALTGMADSLPSRD